MTGAPAARAASIATRTPAQGDRILTWLLAASLIGAVLQITVGGVVRVTGSGLGCPDWPLCHGSIVPVFHDYHVALEWSHRATGTLVGLTLIAAVLRAWLPPARWGTLLSDRAPAMLVVAALALTGVVGAIGGAVVLSELDPAIRTVHLALAEGVVLLIAWAWATSAFAPLSATGRLAAVQGRHFYNPNFRSGLIRLTAISAALSLLALLSGAYAVWKGAGFVCPSWPLCGGPLLPDTALTWTHAAHRLLALMAVLAAMWAAWRAFFTAGAPAQVRAAGASTAILVTAQVLIGAANPWSGFQQWARSSHLTAATLVWAALVITTLLVSRPVPRSALVDEVT